jgi:hypothetical protein
VVSFQVQRCVVAARAVAAVSLALLSCHALAQAEAFEPVANNDAQQAIVNAIAAEQSRAGAFSPALIAPYTELADAYRAAGDHDLAAAANARALQLLRVNEGLYTLDQVPLLVRAIENAEQRGDAVAARDLRQQLQGLVARHPQDERVAPVLRDFGDREVRALRQLLAGELPPEIRFGDVDPNVAYFGTRELR